MSKTLSVIQLRSRFYIKSNGLYLSSLNNTLIPNSSKDGHDILVFQKDLKSYVPLYIDPDYLDENKEPDGLPFSTQKGYNTTKSQALKMGTVKVDSKPALFISTTKASSSDTSITHFKIVNLDESDGVNINYQENGKTYYLKKEQVGDNENNGYFITREEVLQKSTEEKKYESEYVFEIEVSEVKLITIKSGTTISLVPKIENSFWISAIKHSSGEQTKFSKNKPLEFNFDFSNGDRFFFVEFDSEHLEWKFSDPEGEERYSTNSYIIGKNLEKQPGLIIANGNNLIESEFVGSDHKKLRVNIKKPGEDNRALLSFLFAAVKNDRLYYSKDPTASVRDY